MGLDYHAPQGEEYEKALIATGFGKFHFQLMTICGFIYLNSAIGITSLSFILPAATCDFEMSSEDKGWLLASPMLGMVIGSYFWGCIADTRGRRVGLIAALLVDGICGILSSLSPYYLLFIIMRFLNGFCITGAMGIIFPYLGEFQPSKYRETILSWMEMFWTLGIIVLPVIAWIVIPMDFRLEHYDFRFSSWNLFVAISGIPSILIALWLFTFPESPKFLLECGEADLALDILRKIYTINTGKDSITFPVLSLRERIRTVSVVSQRSTKSVRNLSMTKPKELKILLLEIWFQTKCLFKTPHLRYTLITCIIQFGVTSSYYTLTLWSPEIFHRFKEFEKLNPGEPASLCLVSSIAVSTNETLFEPYCGETIDNSVFLHTLFTGLACVPTSIWMPLCVHRLGTKFFLVFSLLLAGGVTCGIYFVQTSTQNLILFCIFEASTSLAVSTLYCVLVDLFPTHLRVMAAALSVTFGRIGALVGDILFGVLIDLNCVVPIAIFGSMLFGSALLCLLLPNADQIELN